MCRDHLGARIAAAAAADEDEEDARAVATTVARRLPAMPLRPPPLPS